MRPTSHIYLPYLSPGLSSQTQTSPPTPAYWAWSLKAPQICLFKHLAWLSGLPNVYTFSSEASHRNTCSLLPPSILRQIYSILPLLSHAHLQFSTRSLAKTALLVVTHPVQPLLLHFPKSKFNSEAFHNYLNDITWFFIIIACTERIKETLYSFNA